MNKTMTPARAVSLVNAARKKQAAAYRAKVRADKKARKEQQAKDKKALVGFIRADKDRVVKDIGTAAASGSDYTEYCMGSEPTFLLDRQNALIAYLVKKGFKAERWSQFNPGSNNHDPDWPDSPSYTNYGVKVSWSK